MTKSFAGSLSIGSRRLNALGLHAARVQMAALQRSRLEHLILPEDRESFARDGFVVKRDVLPKAQFEP